MISNEFNKFAEKAKDIYESIDKKAELIDETGLIADGVVTKRQGCLLVVFKFDESISERFHEISSKIAIKYPTLVYKPEDIHTTILTTRLVDNFSGPNEEDYQKLGLLTRAVSKTLVELRPRTLPVLNYKGIIYSTEAILATGFPVEDDEQANLYFDIVSDIISECEALGIKIKKPWGMHSTLSRVIRPVPPEQTKSYKALLKGIKNTDFGEVKLDEIIVGWHTTSPDHFKIHPCVRFKL